MAVDSGLTPTDRLDLVAYLDGELDEENARALAAKLAADLNVRQEAQTLAHTWELLDHLPRPRATDMLGTKTFEAITEIAHESARVETVRSTRGRQWSFVLAGAAILAAFFAGLSLPRLFSADRTGQLARDLGIAERFDQYRSAGSLDFLYLLQKSHEFGDEE